MRTITIFLMKIMLNRANRNRIGKDDIVQRAYDNMIKNYENTIMYLNVNR